MIRTTALGLLCSTLTALALSAVAGLVYGGHAFVVTAEILLPLGWATVALTTVAVSHRAVLGGLRAQFGAIAAIAGAQLAAGVGLFVAIMFVSPHDALLTVLLVVDCGVLALWAGLVLGRRALADLDAVRTTLDAVGEGRRDVLTGAGAADAVPTDELGRLAADVDVMVGRLHDEEEARSRLLAAVSHDLRTPLTALRLLAEAIGDGVVDEHDRGEYARRMGTHLTALSALVDDLFELTRVRSGDLGAMTERVRLDLLVAETVDAMRPTAAAGAVAVRSESAADLAVARANPDKVQRVLYNLIQNAIRHTPPDGEVTVRALAHGGEVEVQVSDTGSGIPAPLRDRVFEPFFRADASRTDAGAGLGLAIAQAIVEAHGGRIWVAEPETGASVRFRLPGVSEAAR
ncbi:sensor histidine kinase [Baekduia sp. Peel2402]|uniref:sensor histidine kinase n=1 Tax=Baekduia sp. Peel2402 TaxID=3458296 RepID=UPI00403EC173